MDLWVMRRGWSPTIVIAYEVKISRSDWLQDDKWRSYLQFCNEFYFVCPSGLIKKEEIPSPAGLKWITDKGRITTRKKADFREEPVNPDVFRYIIMSRCDVRAPRPYDEYIYDQPTMRALENKEAYFRDWMANEKVDKTFGLMVSSKIRKIVEKNVIEARDENEALRRRIKDLEDVKRMLESLGMKPGESVHQFEVRQYMRDKGILPPDMPEAVRSILRRARSSRMELDMLVYSGEQLLKTQEESEALLESAWRQEIKDRIRRETAQDAGQTIKEG